MKKLGFSNKFVIIAIAAFASFSLLMIISVQENFVSNEAFSYDGIQRAAIIDQLHDDIPNKYFQEKASDYLQTAGYEVDLFTTEELTVDFFKKLPSKNYKLIVFRTHAIGNDGPDYFSEEPVSLFTGEKYRDDKYIHEQLSGQIGKGAPLMSSTIGVSADLSELTENNDGENSVVASWEIVDTTNAYFLMGSKYVDELMEDRFPGSILVLGGCSTLSNPTLAKAFVNRGASSVIGWDSLVGSYANDIVILSFLENYLINELDIKDAVNSAMEKAPIGTDFDSNLLYYDSSM